MAAGSERGQRKESGQGFEMPNEKEQQQGARDDVLSVTGRCIFFGTFIVIYTLLILY
jgi:hypothetical protein